MQNLKDKWCVVTGASSGLGLEFAKIMAEHGANLVLVARREEPMNLLAAQLLERHGTKVVVVGADLGQADSAASLQQGLEAQGIEADILINNAAFGLSGPFIQHDASRLRSMLNLDIVAMTELTHVFAQRMAKRGHGHILLVASVAAYQPIPGMAGYGASKAFMLSLGHALNVELAPKVNVTVLSPGLMDTGFLAVADFVPTPMTRLTMLAPKKVARIGIEAMLAKKPSVVAGGINKFLTFTSRFFSRHTQAKMAVSFQ